MDRDFREGSFSDASTHDAAYQERWPATDCRRKRAKSCLATDRTPSFVHREYAHNVERDQNASGDFDKSADTNATWPIQLPVRRRRLAHSLKGGSTKKGNKGKGTRRAGSVDVQFVATMHRSISWQLLRAQEVRRYHSYTGMPYAPNCAGTTEDQDVAMEDANEDSAPMALGQDELLVDRLSRILTDQGFKPLRECELLE